jgi:hypothetical protein
MVGGAHVRSLVLQRAFLLFLPALLLPGNAQAGDKEPTAIVELGGAGEWDSPASSSFGPSAAVEFTPIKEWLEIEAGVAPMFNHGRAEWNTDLLFKKPFTLSDKVEFMIGVGPQWTFAPGGSKIAGEIARLYVLAYTRSKIWLVYRTRLYLFL